METLRMLFHEFSPVAGVALMACLAALLITRLERWIRFRHREPDNDADL